VQTALEVLKLNSPRQVRQRRQWERLPLALPVFVRGSDAKGLETLEFATGLNVSASGILIASRRPLQKGASVVLEVPIAPVAEPASLPKTSRKMKARVVRVEFRGSYHLIGMRFSRSLLPASAVAPAPKRMRKSPSTM
jgi:hypothetical protein